jgi:hypothetical protein
LGIDFSLRGFGCSPVERRSGSAAEFGKFIDDETRKWGALIREAGLKGE